MATTIGTNRGRHARHAKTGRNAEPRVLLVSYPEREQADAMMGALARALCELGLARDFGVFVTPVRGWYGVYLGRHDGGPVEATPAALAAAHRIRL